MIFLLINNSALQITNMDTLPFISTYKYAWITTRLWWFIAFVLAIGILPVGIITGLILLCAKGLRQGIKTICYSFIVAGSCIFITWCSIFVPQYGSRKTLKELIDIDDLRRKDVLHVTKFKPRVCTNLGQVDVHEISCTKSTSNRVIIAFPGAGHLAHDKEPLEYLENLSTRLNCTIYAPNYPGTTKGSNYKISSSDDCTNVGIALVNYLISHKQWALTQVAQNLVLFGYSMGGMVAFNVAYYFKTIHGIDIPVFADRSPGDLNKSASNNYTRSTNIPEWYMRVFHYPVFKAANINFRVEKIYHVLTKEKVGCINAENDPAVPHGYGIADVDLLTNSNMRYLTWSKSGDALDRTAHHASPKDLIDKGAGLNAMDYFSLFLDKQI